MRQFITTKYLGPTNYRGSRVKAIASGSAPDHRLELTVDWNSALNVDNNHARAAQALAKKLGWTGRWIAGGGNEGNVYVIDCDPQDGFILEVEPSAYRVQGRDRALHAIGIMEPFEIDVVARGDANGSHVMEAARQLRVSAGRQDICIDRLWSI